MKWNVPNILDQHYGELAELKKKRDELASCLANMTANRDGWEAVAARMEQQRDRLKEALAVIASEPDDDGFTGDGHERLMCFARAALEEVGDE